MTTHDPRMHQCPIEASQGEGTRESFDVSTPLAPAGLLGMSLGASHAELFVMPLFGRVALKASPRAAQEALPSVV
jgi:hypothetical protein